MKYYPVKSIAIIIAFNLIPYLGIIVLGWVPAMVFTCYAMESLVVGVFNVFKMVMVYFKGVRNADEEGPADMGFFAIPAFFLSYGLLAYIQLMLFLSFYGAAQKDDSYDTLPASLFRTLGATNLWAILAYIGSFALLSFIFDFILPKVYLHRTLNEQMAEPFPRVIVGQIVVFSTLFLYTSLSNGIGVLIGLTLFKIAFEVFLLRHRPMELFGWK